MWLLSAVLFLATVCQFLSFTKKVDDFGDNGAYLLAAHSIHDWNFDNAPVKQFWGMSYVIALASSLPFLSLRSALLLICGVCSLASVLFAYQLWGPWIAGYFAVVNFDWLQRSFLGGAEPLFVVLLFASLVCMRAQRWVLGSLLASFATVVRPVGVFALLAIGLVLLFRREYRRFAICTGVGAVIGILYLLPFWIYFHDPLYQFHRYQKYDWNSGLAIALPFQALASSFLHNQEPLTNVALTLGWIILVLVGLLAASRKSFRPYVHEHIAEFVFVFFYSVFLFTYNSGWARAEFPRFALPVVPFVLKALERWVPKSRIALYATCVVGSVLAACSAVGIHNVFAALH